MPRKIAFVAGADIAFRKSEGRYFAAVILMSFPSLEVLEEAVVEAKVDFPYIPGLLTFREGPVVLKALEKLERDPDVVIFDGQGLAHPRRCGLASHMGLWLGKPTVGCAKSRLIGEHDEPGRKRGAWAPLFDKGEVIGTVLRTRTSVKSLYVSPGHLCDHEGARRMVLDCSVRYRLPEPTRLAHIVVERAAREAD